MNAVLIKPDNRKLYSQLMKFLKVTKTPARILSKRDEEDELFINAIEEGVKSGEADKNEMRKFFRKYGIEIL